MGEFIGGAVPIGLAFLLALIVSLVGGLVGSLVGLMGAQSIERQREARARGTARASVLFELSSLSAAVEYLAEGKRTRLALSRPQWQRFGPDLFTDLPLPLMQLLYLALEEGFDGVAMAYEHALSSPLSDEDWEPLRVKFLTTGYQYVWIRDRIQTYLQTKVLGLVKSSADEDSEFMQLVNLLDSDTRKAMAERGITLPESVTMSDSMIPLGSNIHSHKGQHEAPSRTGAQL
ncbi:MAG: hypothetical protein EXR52_05150 [Dehalococcoidia bacterium]|nr:hypothetical protein [Dehalococcoidia bacterium]